MVAPVGNRSMDRDPGGDEVRYHRTYMLTGDKLRPLVAQAEALLDASGRRLTGRHEGVAPPPRSHARLR